MLFFVHKFFFRTLYLVRKNVVRIYSTQTGDFVQEFEPSDYRIVNILMHPENDHAIIGCTERGQLDVWSYPSSIIIKKLVRLSLNIYYDQNQKVANYL